MKKLLLTLMAFLTLSSVAMAETAEFSAWNGYTWTQSGVDISGKVGDFTFLLAKGGSSSDLVKPDAASIRVYAGANLTITAPAGYLMTEVSGLTATGNKALGTSVVGTTWKSETGTITANANQAIKFTAAVGQSSITFDGDGKQLRIKSLKITYSKPDPTKKDAELSFPQAEYTATIGEAFTQPELTKATDAALTYTSSKPAVATVDPTTGVVTLVRWGETTITVTAPANDKYNSGSASYVLKVNDPNGKGTISNPYTVAEAIEACADGDDTHVYAKGIVVSIKEGWNSQFSNVTYFIADSKDAAAADQLQVYRGKWGTDIAGRPADSNPEVGATVLIKGELTLYNGAPQIAAGSTIEEYTAPLKPLGNITWSWGEGNTGTLTGGQTVSVKKGNDLVFTAENATKMEYSYSMMGNVTTKDAEGNTISYQILNNRNNFKVTATGVDETGAVATKTITFNIAVVQPELGEITVTLPDGITAVAGETYTVKVGEKIAAEAADATFVEIQANGVVVAQADASSLTWIPRETGDAIPVTVTVHDFNKVQKQLSFVLNIAEGQIPNDGTLEHPYTVAEAIAKCAEGATGVYVKGIVVKASAWSTQYNNVNYYIGDTKTAEAADQLMVYAGSWCDALKAQYDGKAPEVGATVIVKGNLKVFNSTNEFDKGSTIESYTPDGQSGIDAIEAADADAVEYYNLQGVRVAEPTPGLYIRRQGGKISKVIVK